MIRFAVVAVLAVVVSLICWSILNTNYAYDAFASDEAKASLEVTEAQTLELLSSRQKSDALAFGLFGALLALVCGAVSHGAASARSATMAAGLGFLIGAAAGALGSYLAHLHDANIAVPADPMFYWFVRWAAILLPIGLASGIAGQLSGTNKFSSDGILGGMIGAAVAVVLYCLASGSLTPMESHHEVFPAHSENRLLVFGLASLGISLTITFQLGRQKTPSKSRSTEKPPK